MSKKRREAHSTAEAANINDRVAVTETAAEGPKTSPRRVSGVLTYLRGHIWATVIIAVLSVGALGSVLKYLEEDAKRELAKNSKDRSTLSSINPFMPAPPPSPTPQLSKEYIYAGSRLLAVEDANASAVPPGDIAVWRSSNGYWYVKGQTGSTETYYQWGNSSDVPGQGDYDGDGKTDFAVYRGSAAEWYIVKSSDNTWYAVSQGTAGDKPVQGDYDGDGKTDTALFRASNSTWYIKRSSDSSSVTTTWGTTGDKTAHGDYDGDGKTDLAIWRPSSLTFYALNSTDGNWTYATVGSTTSDTPVPGDYDGDGKTDMAVLSGNSWISRSSASGSTGSPITWENSGDTPAPFDYDGDGKTDIAVWRNSNGNWYIRKSSASGALQQVAWGTSGDIPVPGLYRR